LNWGAQNWALTCTTTGFPEF